MAKKKNDIRILILQRGWVMVGKFSQSGSQVTLNDGFVIRNWGTSNGLGEIAVNGPTSNTKLDSIPETYIHELTIVAQMSCEAAKWESKIK